MSFKGTTGSLGEVRLYNLTGTTVGSLAYTLNLIGSLAPKEAENGLLDLEVKSVELRETYTTFIRTACPYGAAATTDPVKYELDNGDPDLEIVAGSTGSSKPQYLVVAIGPQDADSGDAYTIVEVMEVERGSRDFATGKGKANEVTTKLKGVVPTGEITVTTAYYGAKVTGVATTIDDETPHQEQWLAVV